MPRFDNAPGDASLEYALAIRLDRRFWALYGAAWLGVLLFFYSRAFTLSFSRDTPFQWRQDALETLATYAQWALYAPLIVWAARRVSFFRGCRRKALAFHAALSILVALAAVGVQTFWAGRIWTDETARYSRYFSTFFHWDVMFYWLILSVTQGLEYQRRWQRDQLQASHLETELARAELRALRMQMEPHFLYNTLHTVSEMVHVDPAAAERMIVRLGSLLRHTTETGSQEVPLEREVEFLGAYLEIEQARFHDRLTVSIDVPEELLACAVPSLILQPLVENAIRHGTGRVAGAGTVRIAAARQEGALVLRVTDNGPGLHAPGRGRGAGVGLRNIRSRLRHLYGPAGSLELRPADGGGLEA
ncbi:MAG TPA: sensor histidine kinase, partial [Longimicrobium sp.]|nr:sensor histidine kinase [Longimicrobium sp.]